MADASIESSEATSRADELEGELPKLDLLDYLIYPPFFFAFLGTLLFFELLFRVAQFRPMAVRERVAAAFNRWVVRTLYLVGVRVRYDNHREYPTGRPYLIVSNHQSMFDISILHQAFAAHRPKFVAKKELSRGIPGVSICLRTEGAALIDRSNPRQAIPAIQELGKRMAEEHFSVILFPEGTRARRGKMKAFKSGGMLNLLKKAPDVQIIPAALDGSWKIAGRKLGPVPRGTLLHVKFGEPISCAELGLAEAARQAEHQVRTLLQEIRQEEQAGS
ncbi:MAG: 1-acyl-sn-glycerol-3-phosphate acyltransferase [Bdellovibrionales bacterium]|nr:1-acyl-sn-glycerol-3-phosphate acyltransferase [Bdellovibrionales bacterium]